MTQIMYPNQNNSHGLACDGLQIARDDLREIENMQTREDAVWELFQNAARIRKSMRTNGLLRPIFRKYMRACREILKQKKDETAQLLILCDHCDAYANDSKHDLQCIQREMREIHNKTKSLEDLQPSDNESDLDSSDSEEDADAEDDADDADAEEDAEYEDDAEDDDDDSISSSSSSSSSSASSLSDIIDMENFA